MSFATRFYLTPRTLRWKISSAMLGAILAATAPALSSAYAQSFSVIDNFDDGNDNGWSRFVQGWLNTDEGAWQITTGRYNMRSTLNIPSGQDGTVLSVLNASTGSNFRNGTWRTKIRINNSVCSASVLVRATFNNFGLPFAYALDLHANNNLTRSVELYRLDGSSDTLLGSINRTTLNITSNNDYWIEVKTDGSTIAAKVWRDGNSAPSNPQITINDNNHQSGQFVLSGYKSDNLGTSSVNVSFDDVQFASIASPPPPPPPPPPPVIGDFNGDRAIDILWRNKSSGFNVIWLCDQTPGDGSFVLGSASLSTVAGDNWLLIGKGDFNADGKTDILWRNEDTGDNVVWFMNGTTFVSAGSIFSVAGDQWVIAGIGDFNSDTKPDLLWRNTKTGDNVVWVLNGTTVTDAVQLPAVTDRSWLPAAVGDLTGDTKPDILWRNQLTGALSIWELNGTTYLTARALSAGVADVNWQVADLADFTGDGRNDIIWRNTLTGQNLIWQMNNLAFTSSINLPTIADTNWYVSGMSDTKDAIKKDNFSGNGRADVVWRNTATGDSAVWLMASANALVTSATLPQIADPNWSIQATGDINRDNRPDIIWRNSVTGENIAWLMNGATLAGPIALPMVTGPWSIIAVADADRNGVNDIYWRNTTSGDNIVWLLDGTPTDSSIVIGTLTLPTVTGPWTMAGVDDIDDNGTSDIVWRNTALGDNAAWFMTGTQIARVVTLPAIADQAWQIGKVSDMNDDGIPDLLWRNGTTGDNSIWLLDPADNDLYTGFLSFPSVQNTNWRIAD